MERFAHGSGYRPLQGYRLGDARGSVRPSAVCNAVPGITHEGLLELPGTPGAWLARAHSPHPQSPVGLEVCAHPHTHARTHMHGRHASCHLGRLGSAAMTTRAGLPGRALKAAVGPARRGPRPAGSPAPSQGVASSPRRPRSPPHGVLLLGGVSSHAFGVPFLLQRVRHPLPPSGRAGGARGVVSAQVRLAGTQAGLGSLSKGI